jgi:NAD(P)H dehydrogenase (quinone)
VILVTGAAGKTGRAVIHALVKDGQTVRALVRRVEQVDLLLKTGAAEVHVGELLALEDVGKAVHGVRAIYHICPNMSPYEVGIGKIAIQAAVEAGLGHFVYHSVLHPQVEGMPHHWNKMRVEEMLFASSLNYTILQPAAYMQNILGSWDSISGDGLFEVPYSVEARSSIVDLIDVAEVAKIVLTEGGHGWATFELCGPEPLSQEEIAEVLSEQLGHSVTARRLSIGDWKQRTASVGLSTYAVEALVAMFEYYDSYGFEGNSAVLDLLLRRPATTFKSFVERIVRKKDEDGPAT